MDPISNIDQLVLMLQQRLTERSTLARRSTGKAPAKAAPKTVLEKTAPLAGVDGLTDQQLGRALVQNILIDQFGDGAINAPKFQLMIDQILTTVEKDRGASALMGRIIDELRATAA